MTDYDPKPTAYHTTDNDVVVKDGNGAMGWIIGLLILAAILAALWWFFKPEVDMDVDLPRVEVEGGDVDADMSINPVDIDVDLPEVEVRGGDVDVTREGRQDVDVPDVDVEVEGGDIDMPEVDVDVEPN